jgi:cytochrome c oxidase cbb3-type subunit II
MKLFSNHHTLYWAAFIFFTLLSLAVAILPAISNQENNAPLPGAEILSEDALAGKRIFIANGCVACHSQQVRDVAMDQPWGARPSIAADYAANTRMDWWMNTATLMGTERTGPDLTNIGTRLPSIDWHLLHLYNPRAVMEESIMPAYPWMFEVKEVPADDDKIVNVPEDLLGGVKGAVVARREALQLVAYLQSLKQAPLPSGIAAPGFRYQQAQTAARAQVQTEVAAVLDGTQLYATHCQACHQQNGQGLPGAFPPLKGSPIVLDDDPKVLIDIIMNGYNPREVYAVMPPVGSTAQLKPAEVAAIVNHERSSWGNQARTVSVEEVEQILALIEQQNLNP